MRRLLGSVADPSVINKINRFELFTDGRSATVPLQEPDLIIERSILIRSLAEQAQQRGACLELGRRFSGLQPKRNRLELTFQPPGASAPRRVTASAVVGADGAYSSVARAAGWPPQSTVPLIQAQVDLPSGIPSDVVRVWFLPDDTPYFYWLIPESRTRGVLGLIGTEGKQTRNALQRFLRDRHFRPLGFQAARIPLYSRWIPVQRKLGQARVFLVGDAAGQVKVSTVGGIVTGFRGALGVSQAILNHGKSPELRALRRELDLHLLIRRSLHRFRQEDYSRLVYLLSGSLLDSLGRISRDEAARVLWHVCRTRPRLLLAGLRGLVARNPLETKKARQ